MIKFHSSLRPVFSSVVRNSFSGKINNVVFFLEYTERQNFQPVTTVDSGATNCPGIDENILLVLGDKKLLIPKESLQITEKIGQGN